MPTFAAGQILTATALETTVGGLLAQKPSLRAVRNSTQSIANATYTAIQFDTEVWDYGGGHSTVTDPNKVYALLTAKHLMGAIWEFANSAVGGRFAKLLQNGSGNLGEKSNASLGVHPNTMGGQEMHLSQLDFLELQLRQDTGGALNVNYAALWITWMQT